MNRRQWFSSWSLKASIVAGCLVVGGLVSGCTAARTSLGTSDDSCYLALPAASAAVHNHGHLIGVHLFVGSKLRQTAPAVYRNLESELKPSDKVCVTAFTGTFSRATVDDAHGRTSGVLLVVVTTTPSNHLLGTVIFKHAPLHFGHTHLG